VGVWGSGKPVCVVCVVGQCGGVVGGVGAGGWVGAPGNPGNAVVGGVVCGGLTIRRQVVGAVCGGGWGILCGTWCGG